MTGIDTVTTNSCVARMPAVHLVNPEGDPMTTVNTLTPDLVQFLCTATEQSGLPATDVQAMGNPELLRSPLLGFFCSVRCPGKVILHVYDLADAILETGITLVSGFHAPIEQELLWLVLRRDVPVVICVPHRLTGKRIPAAWRPGLDSGRMLLLSTSGDHARRTTSGLADQRNLFAAALAHQVIVASAAPGGHVARLCATLARWQKPVATLDEESAGLNCIRPDAFGAWWSMATFAKAVESHSGKSNRR